MKEKSSQRKEKICDLEAASRKPKAKNGKYDREERSPKHKMNVEEKSILVV